MRVENSASQSASTRVNWPGRARSEESVESVSQTSHFPPPGLSQKARPPGWEEQSSSSLSLCLSLTRSSRSCLSAREEEDTSRAPYWAQMSPAAEFSTPLDTLRSCTGQFQWRQAFKLRLKYF